VTKRMPRKVARLFNNLDRRGLLAEHRWLNSIRGIASGSGPAEVAALKRD
jgi:hypothetical protein